jgi:hypothetical protein
LRNIVTHDVGLFLGLAHTTDAAAVMWARYHSDSTVLTNDDVGGICSIYLADQTRSTSAGAQPEGPCDPTARHGFSSECGSLHPNPPPADNAQGSSHKGCSVGPARGSERFATGWFALFALAARLWRRRDRATRR